MPFEKMLVGICGPSNSGKSSLCKTLEKNHNASWMEVDHYLKELEDVPFLGSYRNWDLPENHRFDVLFGDIQKLLRGKQVKHPIYAFRKGRIQGSREVRPSDMILVDGFYAFYDERVRDLYDLKIYLDLPEEELIRRRVGGDKEGEWPNFVFRRRDYIENIVIPMYREYGATQKSYADFVIDATLPREEVLAQVLSIIN